MSNVIVDRQKIDVLANAISVKSGEPVTMTLDEMVEAVDSIEVQTETYTERTASDLTVSGATVTVPSGLYRSQATKSVDSGTAGTPIATKGTVSNHSISVTPSVTNTTGYITGSTISGTAVTVSASELVSGNLPITQNGTNIDVTNYATVSVDVAGSGGSIWQDENGYIHLSPDGSGGGSTPVSPKQVNFIDYDGTVLYAYTATEANALTELPSNPTHSGLTSQGWNWTLAQIKAQLTALPNGPVWVGQMYVTTSGDTEIDVVFTDSARLSPYFSCAVNGTISIDWGDNTTPSTLTGTSLSTRVYTQHVYASKGNYTIKVTVTSGSWAVYGSSATYSLLNKNDATSNANRIYSSCIRAVRLGSKVSVSSYAFANCYSLASLTIPNTVTSIGASAFYMCYSLMSVTVPNTVTEIGNQAFYNCYSLKRVTIPCTATNLGGIFSGCASLSTVTIPNTVTNIPNNLLYGCYPLESVAIPNTVTSIGSGAFYYCYALASITIPSTVTDIGNNAFANCYGVAEYHIKPTSPPTLGTSVFNNIQSDCIIYVPSASLSTYKSASNWSSYASYMVGE